LGNIISFQALGRTMAFGNFLSHPIQEILLLLLVQENGGPVDPSHPDVV
jgi:hypothetical protein